MDHDIPTVVKSAHFDAVADAKALRAAMKGLGTDEMAIINILCKRSNKQRQAIDLEFSKQFGRNLIDDLKSELSRHFETLVLGLMVPTPLLCARELKKAMKGLGTDEDVLVEMLCARSTKEVKKIVEAYDKEFGGKGTLEKDVRGDTSGPFERMLIMAIAGARDDKLHDKAKACEQAAALYKAGEARLGTDEDTFVQILSSLGPQQAQLVFSEYTKLASGHSIDQALAHEFSGHLLTGVMAIVRSLRDRHDYFAERLDLAMKGYSFS